MRQWPKAKTAHELEPFSLTIYSDYIRDLYYAGRLTRRAGIVKTRSRWIRSFARAHYELGFVLEEAGQAR